MIIEFSENLEKQAIRANGNEIVNVLGQSVVNNKRINQLPFDEESDVVATIDYPKMIWDPYRVFDTDNFKPLTALNILALFSYSWRVTRYDGLSIWYDKNIHLNVWAPTIDTLVLANAMRLHKDLFDGVKSVIDVGCGSGFLGLYAQKKIDSISARCSMT